MNIESYRSALENSKMREKKNVEYSLIQTHLQEMFKLKDNLDKEEQREAALKEIKSVRKLKKYNLVTPKKKGWGRKTKMTFSDSLPVPRKGSDAPTMLGSPKITKKFFSKSPKKESSNLVEWSDRWEKKDFKVSTLNKIKWTNTDEEKSELIKIIPGWSFETGNKKPSSMHDPQSFILEDPESYRYLYRDFFFKHDHSIYYGDSKVKILFSLLLFFFNYFHFF